MRSVIVTLFLLFFPLSIFADSQQSARRAQTLLGPQTWSRVIQIENTHRRGAYPSSLYALVFEFSGILWFYTEVNGTQSFSLWTNRLEKEKADFSQGLRMIDPGFVRYSVIDDNGGVSVTPGELPNGCFIESVIAGRKRLAENEAISEARLVMYYPDRRSAGHCVLAYATPEGVFVLDPTQKGLPRRIGSQWPDDPVKIAQAVRSTESYFRIKQARTLEFPPPVGRTYDRLALASRTAPGLPPTLRTPGQG